MPALLAVDQFLDDVVEVEDDGLVLIDHVLHLFLALLLLLLPELLSFAGAGGRRR